MKNQLLPQSVFENFGLETAERGCLSRSTFDNPKTRGISCAHSAIQAAAGGTPALRSTMWLLRGCALAALIALVACTTPIGADQVSPRQAYLHLHRNALNSNQCSGEALRVLEKILRYETKLERQLYRAMAHLERLQRMRRGESVSAPLTVEVSERA
jgi:hypothetical protein